MSRSRALAAGFIVAGSLLALVGSGLTAARALAVFHDITENGMPGLLSLAVDDNTPLWVTLEPGKSATWHVRSSLADAEYGTLEIELDAYGGLIDATDITVRVDACTQHFDPVNTHLSGENVSCSGTRSVVLQPTALSYLAQSGDRYQLASLYRNAPRELLVTLTIPSTADPQAIAGEDVHIGLGVHASGESGESTGDEPSLPSPPRNGGLQVTGSDVSALSLLMAGMASVVIGLTLLRRSRTEAVRRGGE